MKLLVMSFDGETKLETPEFKTVQDVWEYSGDIGSKWYFYPFHFVVTNSGKTIKEGIFPLEFLMNTRVKTVSRRFAELQAIALNKEENIDSEQFAFYISDNF